MPLMATAATDMRWQQAWRWLCQQRGGWPANADIWDLRWRWAHPEWRQGDRLYQQVTRGLHRFQPLQKLARNGDAAHVVWSSTDAMVLKWLALQLADCLPVHAACTHVAGHGGLAGSRRAVSLVLSGSALRGGYVFRTDILGYYRHITADSVAGLAERYVHCPVLRDLMLQYARANVESGGLFFTPAGITRGCALSPLVGASLLYDLDEQMASLSTKGVHYTRYMDDMLILAPSRWAMRRARERLLSQLDRMGFSLHPDKTQVGRLPHAGFDWLGWQFQEGRIFPAPRAWQHHQAALQSRGAMLRRRGLPEAVVQERMRQYRQRWITWFRAGLPETSRDDMLLIPPCPEKQWQTGGEAR